MAFDVEIGIACERGPRERNDDCAGARRDAGGLIAALADGVSYGGGGALAAQTAVAALLDDFFAAPDTWEPTVVFDRLLLAHNAWLVNHNRHRHATARQGAEPGTAMTTLTALALHGHGWTLAHVGDSRAWRLRGGELDQLSTDHHLDHPDLGAQLTRAVGLDDHLHVDYLQGELQAGDLFMLTSDGVHGTLPPRTLARLAAEAPSAEAAAQSIVRAALDAGSHDNASALVLRLRGLDAGTLDDALRRARTLPVPGALRVGDRLDGYAITALVADNGVHRLLQARAPSGELVALKTLSRARAADPQERALLAHEAWLGERAAAADPHGFVRVREPAAPSAFYTVYDWVPGRTLQQWLAAGRRFGVAEVVDGALQIVRALGRLHRQGVIHRDITPANLHLGDDGRWRIIDLGVALSGREPAAARELHAGHPSYINPEQWDEPPQPADAASDLYALGVTLYRWLAGALPYGEIEPYQRQRFRRDPPALSRRRPDVPIWLDHLVLKAVARDPKQRFETAEEMGVALERGASRPLPPPAPTPLIARDPAALWKIGLVISLLLNALLVAWLLWLPR